MKHQIWTIGHSTLPIEAFLHLLATHKIRVLADVRRFPMSRRHPHFNAAPLQEVLAEHGIKYQPFPDLGGRRPPRPDSPHTAWRNDSFRGYADYMETPEFEAAVAWLVKVADENPTAIMCAEAVWWRCHRGLISDYLKVRDWRVLHIMNADKAELHPYTSAAHVENGVLSYAAVTEQLALGFSEDES